MAFRLETPQRKAGTCRNRAWHQGVTFFVKIAEIHRYIGDSRGIIGLQEGFRKLMFVRAQFYLGILVASALMVFAGCASSHISASPKEIFFAGSLSNPIRTAGKDLYAWPKQAKVCDDGALAMNIDVYHEPGHSYRGSREVLLPHEEFQNVKRVWNWQISRKQIKKYPSPEALTCKGTEILNPQYDFRYQGENKRISIEQPLSYKWWHYPSQIFYVPAH